MKTKNKEDDNPRTKNQKQSENNKSNKYWPIKMTVLTFVIAAVFAFLSEIIKNGTSVLLPIIILFVLIIIGCVFDVIGVAVASCDTAPFVAMSSKKVRGAKECIEILKNADKVSNICNDVIGDICGVVSGAAAASIVIIALDYFGSSKELLLSIIASATVSALTVGGKAAGKSIAMKNSKEIVFTVGKVFSFFKR